MKELDRPPSAVAGCVDSRGALTTAVEARGAISPPPAFHCSDASLSNLFRQPSAHCCFPLSLSHTLALTFPLPLSHDPSCSPSRASSPTRSLVHTFLSGAQGGYCSGNIHSQIQYTGIKVGAFLDTFTHAHARARKHARMHARTRKCTQHTHNSHTTHRSRWARTRTHTLIQG